MLGNSNTTPEQKGEFFEVFLVKDSKENDFNYLVGIHTDHESGTEILIA